MQCQQFHDRLNDLIDREISAEERRELEKHLDECAPCRESHAEAVLLKRTVRERASRPVAPPDLSARVRLGLHEHHGGPQRYAPRAAAAILVVGAVAVGIYLYLGSGLAGGPKLSHAAASESCAEEFRHVLSEVERNGCPDGCKDGSWREEVKDQVSARLGAHFRDVPAVGNARFLRWRPQSVGGVKAIRLDFKPDPEEDGARGPALISVFLFPMRSTAFSEDYARKLEKLHCCTKCIAMHDGSVFCYRRDDVLVTVVSNLPSETVRSHLTAP